MKGVASPVSHIFFKLVLFQHDIRVFTSVSVPKVGVLDVNHTTCRADITIEDVVFENDGALIAFNHERSHILHG